MFGKRQKQEIDQLVNTIEDKMLDETSWVEEAHLFDDGSMSLLIGHADEREGSIVDLNPRKVDHVRRMSQR